MPKIYLSYRWDDSRDWARRIYDRLVTSLGQSHIIIDGDSISIPYGMHFRESLANQVAECQVMLVLIGDKWLNSVDANGRRRIDNPSDFVRLEIESALARKMTVIPVLVGEARVPQLENLPESLRELAFCHMFTVRHDPDFHRDIDRLIQATNRLVSNQIEDPSPPQAAFVPPELSPIVSPISPAEAEKTRVEKSRAVFLSYRRVGEGAHVVRSLQAELRHRGCSVFLDVDSLRTGHFDDALLLEIENARNFIVILSPGCLDRCNDDQDWFRREIAHALSTERNIIPILMDGFDWPDASSLPENIRAAKRHHGIHYSHEYFVAMMDKIEKFLK